MKKNETREETLERLARDASKGKGAAKGFERIVKRAAATPSATGKFSRPRLLRPAQRVFGLPRGNEKHTFQSMLPQLKILSHNPVVIDEKMFAFNYGLSPNSR